MHVFITHSHHDRPTADRIREYLESASIPCWIAPRDIPVGEEWAEAIMNGIESASGMLLVFSSHSNNSPQVRREIERAIHNGIPIFPVRIEDKEPSRAMEYYISSHHWMDAYCGQFEEKMPALVSMIKKKLNIRDEEIDKSLMASAEEKESDKSPGDETKETQESATGEKVQSTAGKAWVFERKRALLGLCVALATTIIVIVLSRGDNEGNDSAAIPDSSYQQFGNGCLITLTEAENTIAGGIFRLEDGSIVVSYSATENTEADTTKIYIERVSPTGETIWRRIIPAVSTDTASSQYIRPSICPVDSSRFALAYPLWKGVRDSSHTAEYIGTAIVLMNNNGSFTLRDTLPFYISPMNTFFDTEDISNIFPSPTELAAYREKYVLLGVAYILYLQRSQSRPIIFSQIHHYDIVAEQRVAIDEMEEPIMQGNILSGQNSVYNLATDGGNMFLRRTHDAREARGLLQRLCFSAEERGLREIIFDSFLKNTYITSTTHTVQIHRFVLPRGLMHAPEGNLYVVGSENWIRPFFPDLDFTVAMIDTTGKLFWRETYSEPINSKVNGAVLLDSSHIAVYGASISQDGSKDGVVFCFDADVRSTRVLRYDLGEDEEIWGLAPLTCEHLAVVITSDSPTTRKTMLLITAPDYQMPEFQQAGYLEEWNEFEGWIPEEGISHRNSEESIICCNGLFGDHFSESAFPAESLSVAFYVGADGYYSGRKAHYNCLLFGIVPSCVTQPMVSNDNPEWSTGYHSVREEVPQYSCSEEDTVRPVAVFRWQYGLDSKFDAAGRSISTGIETVDGFQWFQTEPDSSWIQYDTLQRFEIAISNDSVFYLIDGEVFSKDALGTELPDSVRLVIAGDSRGANHSFGRIEASY